MVTATRTISSRDRSDNSVRGSPEAVADQPDGVDQRRSEPVELLPEVADVGLDDVGVAVEVVLPHVVEDLRLGEDPSRVEEEEAQQVELGGGEVDGGAVPPDLPRVLVHDD